MRKQKRAWPRLESDCSLIRGTSAAQGEFCPEARELTFFYTSHWLWCARLGGTEGHP